MTKKKITILIIVVVVLIIGVVGIYYVAKGGFTDKQRYENCAETCEELMFNESNIPQCKKECESITEYSPTADETKETDAPTTTKVTNTAKNTNNKKINLNTAATVNKNTTTSNINTEVEIDQNAEFYCGWEWPQEIIYRDTGEVVKACTYTRPWCNYDDYSYENAGCCSDRAHTDCVTLPNL